MGSGAPSSVTLPLTARRSKSSALPPQPTTANSANRAEQTDARRQGMHERITHLSSGPAFSSGRSWFASRAGRNLSPTAVRVDRFSLMAEPLKKRDGTLAIEVGGKPEIGKSPRGDDNSQHHSTGQPSKPRRVAEFFRSGRGDVRRAAPGSAPPRQNHGFHRARGVLGLGNTSTRTNWWPRSARRSSSSPSRAANLSVRMGLVPMWIKSRKPFRPWGASRSRWRMPSKMVREGTKLGASFFEDCRARCRTLP